MNCFFFFRALLLFSSIRVSYCHLETQDVHLPSTSRAQIPNKVLIGYASHNYTNVMTSVIEDGVNIVIWAFVDVRSAIIEPTTLTATRDLTSSTRTTIRTNLDMNAITSTINQLQNNGHSHVIHLSSIGGWNGQHLDENLSPTEWYEAWKSAFSGVFHGIDWDLEGNDDLTSENNVFSIECLERMGEISRLFKEDGYIVTMAPPQSYLNICNPTFSRYVNLTSPTRAWHPEFHYFGSNVYAYLVARYGEYIDLVSIQLYESYSDASMVVYHEGISAEDYLFDYIQRLASQHLQFYVDFSQDAALYMTGQSVPLSLEKLVIGLANGWALNTENEIKVLYISSEQCKDAYERLKVSSGGNLTPRGFMFWTMEERGVNDVYLAKGLGQFLDESNS